MKKTIQQKPRDSKGTRSSKQKEPPEPKEAQQWLKENAKAIEAYNEHVSENGVFGEEYRTF